LQNVHKVSGSFTLGNVNADSGSKSGNSQSQQHRQPVLQSYVMSRQTNNTSMVYDRAVNTNCYQGIREVPWLGSTGFFAYRLISAGGVDSQPAIFT